MPRKSDPADSKLDKFVNHAVIDAIVPDAEELDASEFSDTQYTSFRDEDEEPHLSLNVPRRKTLYLDEKVNVYIVLRTPFLEEAELQSHLSRLSLSLETIATGYPAQGKDDGKPVKPIKDVIDSRKVQGSDDPLVIVGDAASEDDSSQERSIYVLWKVEVQIARSKIRCLKPAVHFVPTASVRPSKSTKAAEEDFMPSGVPAPANVLELLRGDPLFDGDPPVLLTSRMAKVPSAPHIAEEFARQLKTAPRRPLPVVPAVSTRLRFSRLGLSPVQAKVLASLDFEVSAYLDGVATINTVDFTLSEGNAELMTLDDVLSLPLTCRAHDELTFVYNLKPDRRPFPSALGKSSSLYTLTMSANVSVCRNDDPKTQSKINLGWRTTVDLSQLTKSHLSATSSTTSSNPSHDITMTISGPSLVYVRESFKWQILLANRSASRSLRLALVPIPKIGNQHKAVAQADRNRHKSVLSASSVNSSTLGDPNGQNRGPRGRPMNAELEPVMDPVMLYNHTHPSTAGHYSARSLSSVAPTRMIPLSPDVIVGPIPPGACQTAEMEFLVLQEGVLNLDAVRVIDLDNREGLDVIWLPDIVAVRSERDQSTVN